MALSLLPAALLLRALAFANPDFVETVFARRLYPAVARVLGAANRPLAVPLAEVACLAALIVATVWTWRRWRRAPRGRRRRLHVLGQLALALWTVAGVAVLLFLFAWGLHYARAPLRERLGLDVTAIETTEVLALAERFVAQTNSAYAALAADPEAPSVMELDLAAVNALIDASYERIELPGDAIRFGTSPAKGLLSSSLFARLGIAGIFIPFTGEPLFNDLVPDASKPVSIAHEKAHQRGITDEGEANLAAVMACLGSDDPYLRYAAALYSSSTLLGAAAAYAPDAAQAIAAGWDPGPRRDVTAIRDFWAQYRGAPMRAAGRVNDAYLRSNRVEGGVQSYGRVVAMLVALNRVGRLPAPPS